jgi:hypothetical protein
MCSSSATPWSTEHMPLLIISHVTRLTSPVSANTVSVLVASTAARTCSRMSLDVHQSSFSSEARSVVSAVVMRPVWIECLSPFCAQFFSV